MDFFQVLKNRKAVRSYKSGKIILKKDLTKILESVNLAPSARNLQGYKIYAVSSKEGIVKISHACYNQKSDFISRASAILIFCLDPEKTEVEFGERGKNLYCLQDASIAATYAVLSATALGFSTCWVGNFKEDEMMKVLETRLKPVTAIIIGKSDENPKRPERKKIKEIVTYL